MDNTTSNFLEDTSLTSFNSPVAASTAARNAREESFLKTQNFSGLLQNLFTSQQTLIPEDLIFEETNNQIQENQNSMGDLAHENSSLGLLSLDSLNELSGSVISLESDKKMANAPKKCQESEPDTTHGVLTRRKHLSTLHNKPSNKDSSNETTCKLQKGRDTWKKIGNTDTLNLEKFQHFDEDSDSSDSVETDDKKSESEVNKDEEFYRRIFCGSDNETKIISKSQNKDGTWLIQEHSSPVSTKLRQNDNDKHHASGMQEIAQSSCGQWAERCSTPSYTSGENTLTFIGEMPLAPGMNSKYFRPTSHLSSDEKSSSNFIGFNMSNSTARESLPSILHNSKISNEVDFRKDQITCRSSSFGTYGITMKETEQNQKKSFLSSLKSSLSDTFDVTDTASNSVNMNNLASYLHSTKNNNQRSKFDEHKETVATTFRTSNNDVTTDLHDLKKKEEKAITTTVFNEPSIIYAADNGEFVTDLAYQTDFRSEMQNNMFTTNAFDNELSNAKFEEFFTTDEAAKMLLEDEKEFEKAHMFEGELIGNQTIISIGNSWMPAAQDITCPSWMTNLNESNNCSHMRISIGQFMRGRTEALGTLEGKDANRPTFGIDYLTVPDETNICKTSDTFSSIEALNKDCQASTALRCNETIVLSSSENESHTLLKSHSDSEKDSTSSLLSMSSISKLISEASVSEDPQAMAARFLENVNARKSKRKLAKIQDVFAATLSKTQSTLQASQDSGVHSDLLKLSSDQETSSQSSSNDDKTPIYMQTVLKAKPVYEKQTNSRKSLFSSTFSKQLDNKDFHNSSYHPAKTKLRKSSSTQALSDYNKNIQIDVPTIKNVRATSDTDLSKTPKHCTESSSQTDTSQMFPSVHKSISELSTKVTGDSSGNTLNGKSENVKTMPCHSGSLPNLSSQAFEQIKDNQNAIRNYSSFACEGSHGLKNCHANNILPSFSQPICSTGIAPCSFLASNHVIGHHLNAQSSSGPCATSSSFPLVNPYVTSFQPFHSLTGIPAMINNAPHSNQISANCYHGILLEKKDRQGFAGASTLQYDYEPIHQFSSNPATLQNTSLRKTVELNIAEPICIGDTTQFALVLQNPTSSSLMCNLKVNVSIDEQVLPAAVVSGFSFPHHLQIEAGATRQVKILYTPRQSGRIAALLEVNADTTVPVLGYPLTAVINAEVEWPQVSLDIEGDNDFGTIEECHTARRIATIINHSKVAVPVRLYISEDIQCSHSFSFDVQEINTEEHKNNIVWHFISPKVLVCQLPGKKTGDSSSKLKIPLFFQSGKIKQGNSDEVSAIINATLESSVMCEALGCVRLSTVVGLVRLSIKAPTQGILVFEAKPKCEVQKEISLQNDGSVQCRLNLSFKVNNNYFQVFPSNIELNAEEEKKVQVIFYSDRKCIQENVLQATLENGNLHQLLAVRGECKNKRERKITVIRRNSRTSQPKQNNCFQDQLTSNRSYLAWAGIEIGQSVERKLTLRNNSATESLCLKLVLKGNASGIKLEQHLALNPEVQLEPQEEKAVKLTFFPTDICILNSSLIVHSVQAHNTDLQYVFPLIGYSGVSRIIIEGVNRRDDGSYFLNMCPPDYQNTALSHFTISNIGQRAGYVKVLCFTDYNLVETMSANIVTSQPSEFILHAKETKTLIVACNHGNFIQSSNSLSKQIAVLAIFFGDEILRQKLKRARKKSDVEEYIPPDPLCNVNFTVNYSGENKTSFDGSYPDSPRDVDIFYSNMSRYLIGLDTPSEDSVCDSTLNSIMSLTGLRDSMSCIFENTIDNNLERNNTKEKYSNLSSPPVKGSSSHPCSSIDNHLPSASTSVMESHRYPRRSRRSINDKENIFKIENGNNEKPILWKVEPSLLNIGTEGKEGRICFTNLTDTDLRFRLQWSTNVLCVSPVQGVVLAGSSIGLRVNPIVSSPSISPKEKDSGYVKVFCGGQQKEVLVNIQNYRPSSVRKKHHNNLSKENISLISQRESTQPISTKAFNALESSINCPEEIKLKEAVAGDYSETTFQIRNSTTDTMKWSINPVSDVFVQCYNSTLPLSLDETSQTNISMQSRISNVTNSRGSVLQPIFPVTAMLKFPRTELKKITMLKAKLKNVSAVNHKISIVKPSSPFFVKHTDLLIKSKHYLNLPVYFHPTRGGHFSGSLLIHSDLEYSINIHLIGEGSS